MNTQLLPRSPCVLYVFEYALREGLLLLDVKPEEVFNSIEVLVRSGHDPLQFLLSAPDVCFRDGLVGWQVEEGRGTHWFHPASYLYLKAATAFGGSVFLDSNQSGKAEGNGKFYLKLKYGQYGKFAVDRLVADAQPGERVKEAIDYHRHLREELTKTTSKWEEARPSKFKFGRADAIQVALVQYDNRVAEHVVMPVGRAEYEHMLRLLFLISDAQSARRAGSRS